MLCQQVHHKMDGMKCEVSANKLFFITKNALIVITVLSTQSSQQVGVVEENFIIDKT